MKADVASTKSNRRLIALSLGLFLFAIYLFTYRGGFHSIDEVSIFAVTESLVKFGKLNTDQIAWTQWTTTQAEAQGFFGVDGHVYSKKGLALSLAQAPLYRLALLVSGLGMLQTVSLLNAGLTATTGMLVFMFVYRLRFSMRTAVIVALIFGLATIAFVYAKYLFSEPLAGFLLFLAAYMLYAYRREGGVRHVVIAGLAAGFAVLTRANNLFLLPVFGLYLLWIEYARPAVSFRSRQINQSKESYLLWAGKLLFTQALIAFVLALAVPGLIMLGYNAMRSGNPLQTGYDLTLFSSNPFLGLYKLLFSPLRGLFIYSPILLLTLPGWWRFRPAYPAEAWLFVGLVGITLALFSFWSSGEGLSWGSRFLVPLVPFLTICLAPIVEQVASGKSHLLRFTFYILLIISLFIQILAVAINPWVFLARMQNDFGGEFFLEKTAALYDLRYSQIVGQMQSWSLENSDVAWWQPWGFDGPAFGLSLALVMFSGWLLWRNITGEQLSKGIAKFSQATPTSNNETRGAQSVLWTPQQPLSGKKAPLLLSAILVATIAISYLLLARYNRTDLQFGPQNDAYTQALNDITTKTASVSPIINVAQYHYHIPMNRFKAKVPLIGFAQQVRPLPETALPLLSTATMNRDTWLVTIGFPPAAQDNATEQWLALNTFKATDEWFPDEVRVVHFSTDQPGVIRPINTTLGNEIELVSASLPNTVPSGQSLPVEFTWQPLAQPQTNYNLFLQLLNVDGVLVAQHDSPPNGGYTPTSSWQAGQQTTSRHALSLTPNLPPGDYRLIAGLYDQHTGERLITETGSDLVELGIITVVAGPEPSVP